MYSKDCKRKRYTYINVKIFAHIIFSETSTMYASNLASLLNSPRAVQVTTPYLKLYSLRPDASGV